MADKREIGEEDFDLLGEFEGILESDPLIDEVGFVHPSQFVMLDEEASYSCKSYVCEQQTKDGVSSSNANVSFWNRDHKLGISTQVLVPLYKAGKSAFMASLGEYKTKRNLPDEPENESNSCALTASHHTLESEVLKHSRALLLLSSDFGTAWNARKLILSKKQQLSIFMDELLLSGLVLSYSAKSEQAWNHRRWVIKMIAGRFMAVHEIVTKESELVENIAERSKMNYRAWNHRCWLVSHMTSEQVLHELKKSKNWAGLHIADSSCFHYRRRLMCKILEPCTKKGTESPGWDAQVYQVWKEELDWNKELIKRYVGREALWLHRRFLSLCWMRHFANDLHKAPSQTEHNITVNNEIATFMDNELCLVNSCTNVLDNEFEDFEAQASHAASYMLWLTKIPEFGRILQDKRRRENLIHMLNMACAERSFLWDHLLHFADAASDYTREK